MMDHEFYRLAQVFHNVLLKNLHKIALQNYGALNLYAIELDKRVNNLKEKGVDCGEKISST